MAASSYWQMMPVTWNVQGMKKPTNSERSSDSFSCSDFDHFILEGFSCPISWFLRGYAWVMMHFSHSLGKMMSLHQVAFGYSALCQRDCCVADYTSKRTACAVERKAWHAKMVHLFHVAFWGSKTRDDKQIKKYYMQKGKRFFSLSLFAPFS